MGFPSLFTGFFLVMNQQRWSGLNEASKGWLVKSTGPGLGTVATAAYERSAQKGLEALAAAGASVLECMRMSWDRSRRRASMGGLCWTATVLESSPSLWERLLRFESSERPESAIGSIIHRT